MTDGPSAQAPPDWTRDWAEICRSEWRAMASDREPAEAAAALAALWSEGFAAAAALAALFAAPLVGDGAAGRAWPGQATGTPAALAPSAAVAAEGDDAAGGQRRIAELAARVAELERRLAELGPLLDGPTGR